MIDEERLEEVEDLIRLVNLAGSLNNKANISGNVKTLEELAAKLNRVNYNDRRQSFLLWLKGYLFEQFYKIEEENNNVTGPN